jgi:hypothetical protein
MIAPAATMISEPSKPMVYFVSQSRAAATGRSGISAGKVAPQGDQAAANRGDEQRSALGSRRRGAGVKAAERLGRRDAGGERQLIDVDQLPFERDGQADTQERDGGHPEAEFPAGEEPTGGERERGDRRYEARARHVAGGAGGARHRVILEQAERPVTPAGHDLFEKLEDGVGDDAGGDRDPESPAGLEADVEIRDRHHAADHHAGDHGSGRELHGVVAGVDVVEPPPRRLAVVGERRMVVGMHAAHCSEGRANGGL